LSPAKNCRAEEIEITALATRIALSINESHRLDSGRHPHAVLWLVTPNSDAFCAIDAREVPIVSPSM
jgi:hypothetical protein